MDVVNLFCINIVVSEIATSMDDRNDDGDDFDVEDGNVWL